MAFMGKVGLLHQAALRLQAARPERLWVSDLFPHLAEVADELTVIRSMWSGTGNHTPATYEANSGFRTLGFPGGGYVALLRPGLRGRQPADVRRAARQPRAARPAAPTTGRAASCRRGTRAWCSTPAARPCATCSRRTKLDDATQAARFAAVAEAQSPASGRARRRTMRCKAGMHSYELAARMQLAIPEATDLTQETRRHAGAVRPRSQGMRRLRAGVPAGPAAAGARRALRAALERRGLRHARSTGTRTGACPNNHRRESDKIDRPVAGLLRDLRQRGHARRHAGDLHHRVRPHAVRRKRRRQGRPGPRPQPDGFSVWLAGAGLKHGIAYGTTDDIGWKAAENPVDVHDFHATVLHLLGIDHSG